MPRVLMAPALAKWLTASPTIGANERTVEVSGTTVRDCLDRLFEIYPTLRGYVLDETGSLRHHVVAFINGDALMDKRALTEPVPPDGELSLFQALSGG